MTKKKVMMFSGATLITLLMMGLIGVGAASAQEAPPAPLSERGGGLGWSFLSLARGHRWAMFDVVAEAMGLTPVEFFSELHAGKTAAEVAEEQGVELKEVRDEVKAARVEMQKQAIEQAVADGKLSRERAGWLLEGLDKGFFPKRRAFGRWGRGPAPEGA